MNEIIELFNNAIVWWGNFFFTLYQIGKFFIDNLWWEWAAFLLIMFIRARILESIWRDNPMTIGGYPSEGITFSLTKKDHLLGCLGVCIFGVVVGLVVLLEYATGSEYFWQPIVKFFLG